MGRGILTRKSPLTPLWKRGVRGDFHKHWIPAYVCLPAGRQTGMTDMFPNSSGS